MKTKKSFLWLAFLILATIWILARRNQKAEFNTASGFVFGTVYKIAYQHDADLKPEIEAELKRFDQSLSPFNDSSVISRVNRNEELVTDSFFQTCFNRSMEISHKSIAAAAFVSTCLAYASSFSGLSDTPYHPLLACALFIVPGVPLINFVDDMLDNHLLVGITRASNTVMMVAAMTFGIAFAMRVLVMNDVEIDHKFSELSMVPHDPYYIYAIAAAISAMGFSMIFNIQRRLLWVVAVGGIIAVCTRNFVNFELGYGPVIGSFMGSFVVSVLAVKAVHWCHVPNHVLTIPSVIPMIPGVLMYRSLLAFINLHGVIGEVTNAFFNGINSALIILCISLGVAVPNIFARRYIAKDRQRHLQEELEKRRERGKFIEW